MGSASEVEGGMEMIDELFADTPHHVPSYISSDSEDEVVPQTTSSSTTDISKHKHISSLPSLGTSYAAEKAYNNKRKKQKVMHQEHVNPRTSSSSSSQSTSPLSPLSSSTAPDSFSHSTNGTPV